MSRVESQAISVRSATPADARTLAEFAALAARTFRQAYESQLPWDDVKAYIESAYNEARQAAELANPGIVTLLAEADATLAGFAQLRKGHAPACVEARNSIELWRFYVDTRWQGRGVAQTLMSGAEDAARRREAEVLWLGVWELNARAKAFYAKCGYVKVGTRVVTLGRVQQTDLVLVRALR